MLRLLRRIAAVLPLAALLAAPAYGDPVQLMPGVSYDRQVQFTPHGPVGFTVITAPPPGSGGLYAIGPALAGGTLKAPRERVTDIQKALAATATSVGIQGDFTSSSGAPTGLL